MESVTHLAAAFGALRRGVADLRAHYEAACRASRPSAQTAHSSGSLQSACRTRFATLICSRRRRCSRVHPLIAIVVQPSLPLLIQTSYSLLQHCKAAAGKLVYEAIDSVSGKHVVVKFTAYSFVGAGGEAVSWGGCCRWFSLASRMRYFKS